MYLSLSIQVNFGQEPFEFDLKAKRQEDQADLEASMTGIEVGREELHALIEDYLMTEGYEATLKSFENVTRRSGGEQQAEEEAVSSSTSSMDVEGGDNDHVQASNGSTTKMKHTAAGESTAEERKDGGHEVDQEQDGKLESLVHARRAVMMESLSHRTALKEEIMNGQASQALERMRKRFPHVLKARPLLRFELQVKSSSRHLVPSPCVCIS